MKNESKSRMAEPDLPFLFIPDITEHPADDPNDLFGSIHKRSEFFRTQFNTTGGSLNDQIKSLNERLRLMTETLTMIIAYRDFLEFGHDSAYFRRCS